MRQTELVAAHRFQPSRPRPCRGARLGRGSGISLVRWWAGGAVSRPGTPGLGHSYAYITGFLPSRYWPTDLKSVSEPESLHGVGRLRGVGGRMFDLSDHPNRTARMVAASLLLAGRSSRLRGLVSNRSVQRFGQAQCPFVVVPAPHFNWYSLQASASSHHAVVSPQPAGGD